MRPILLRRSQHLSHTISKLETKLFLSVKITDKKIPSIIPLVFADFLVVIVVFFYYCKEGTMQRGEVWLTWMQMWWFKRVLWL